MSLQTPTCEDMCSFMETLNEEKPPSQVATVVSMERHTGPVVFDLDDPPPPARRCGTSDNMDEANGSGIAGRVVHERRSPHEWYRRKHPELDYARSDNVIEVFGLWSPELMNRKP